MNIQRIIRVVSNVSVAAVLAWAGMNMSDEISAVAGVHPVAFVSALPDQSPADEPAGVLELRVAQVISYQLTQGQSQWGEHDQQMLPQATVELTTARGFAMTIPDTAGTLRGSFASDGSVHATYSSASSTGSTNVELTGRFQKLPNGYVFTYTLVAGQSMAAVVNNTGFGSTGQKAYQASLLLTPA
jgi:hypothetical protein